MKNLLWGLFAFATLAQAQQNSDLYISIDQTSFSVNQLVQDVLVNNQCATVTAIASSTGINFGSSNMYSTVEDLLKFDQGLFGYSLLSKKATSKLLTVNQKLGRTAYGLWGSIGWGKINEPFFYRTGGILGSRANWIRTMDSKKTIIVLSNNNINDLYKLSEELYQLSLDK